MDNDEKNIKKNIIVFKRNESTQKKNCSTNSETVFTIILKVVISVFSSQLLPRILLGYHQLRCRCIP